MKTTQLTRYPPAWRIPFDLQDNVHSTLAKRQNGYVVR